MFPRVIQLQPATTDDTRRALEEVKHLATTDMGGGRWPYRVLNEPVLTQELARLSNATSKGRADVVTFQPCTSYDAQSQDRAIVEEWLIVGRKWTFTAVLDGHLNHATVDFAVQTLPAAVRKNLQSASNNRVEPNRDAVSRALSDAIMAVDTAIISEFVRMFPGGEAQVRKIDDATARIMLNDQESGGYRSTRASRILGGATVLLTLLEEHSGRLWVANLGDSCAVLGHRWEGGWTGELINNIHNGEYATERQRVQSEHAGEDTCVVDNRIIGWLQPTRAIGDAWLKLPSIYTEKVLLHLDAPWFNNDSLARYIPRIKTPPYVSNRPDVHFRQLRRGSSQNADVFLITCSDGLIDLYTNERGLQETARHWAEIVGYALESTPQRSNLAMALLREAIGGNDVHAVSRNLTVEMEERWMDDTTIIIQRFM